MERIFKWKARRAGGRITIYGKTADGRDLRVPNVDVIEATDNGVTATDKNDTKYALMALNALERA